MSKNIFLVGGSHGIGLAMAQSLSKNHSLTIASRTKQGIEDLNVDHIPFDATTDELLADSLPEEIHGFVFCPGSINLKPFKRISMASFRAEMEINFFALVKVAQMVLPRMVPGSSVVFFSTVAVNSGMPFHTSIAAAKGAIEGFTRSLAAEYAPKIRVNCIAPSLVDTTLANRLLNNDKKREMMADRHPLKRVGTPEDIAQMAIFLLEDNSSWITGQLIGVDGGLSTLNLS